MWFIIFTFSNRSCLPLVLRERLLQAHASRSMAANRILRVRADQPRPMLGVYRVVQDGPSPRGRDERAFVIGGCPGHRNISDLLGRILSAGIQPTTLATGAPPAVVVRLRGGEHASRDCHSTRRAAHANVACEVGSREPVLPVGCDSAGRVGRCPIERAHLPPGSGASVPLPDVSLIAA